MRTDPPVAPQADLQQLAEKWRREAEIMVEPLMGAPIPTQAERVLAKALRDCANDLQAALASLGGAPTGENSERSIYTD